MSETTWVIVLCGTLGIPTAYLKWKYNIPDKIMIPITMIVGATVGVIVGLSM